MLRITSGTAKNKRLKIPKIPKFRGVQEVAKLAIFAILGEKIKDTTCLDLYAGSGNMGLEALSRGAKWCDFVDESRAAIKIIEENIKNCGFTEKAEAHNKDSIKYVVNTHEKYDAIFVDPFYDNLHHKFLFQNLSEIINENGLICFLHGKDLDIEKQMGDTNLVIETQRRYGKSYLTVLKPNLD